MGIESLKNSRFYFVKRRLRAGEGVKNCRFWDDIVYGRPLKAFIHFPYFITLPKRKDQVELSIKELSKLSHVMSCRWLYEDVYKYLYSNRNPKTVNGISRVSPLGPKTVELYLFCCKKMYYYFVVMKSLRTSRKIIGLPYVRKVRTKSTFVCKENNKFGDISSFIV